MVFVLRDIKRGFKIKTIMKRHGISATLVIACMSSLDTYGIVGGVLPPATRFLSRMALHGYRIQSHRSGSTE